MFLFFFGCLWRLLHHYLHRDLRKLIKYEERKKEVENKLEDIDQQSFARRSKVGNLPASTWNSRNFCLFPGAWHFHLSGTGGKASSKNPKERKEKRGDDGQAQHGGSDQRHSRCRRWSSRPGRVLSLHRRGLATRGGKQCPDLQQSADRSAGILARATSAIPVSSECAADLHLEGGRHLLTQLLCIKSIGSTGPEQISLASKGSTSFGVIQSLKTCSHPSTWFSELQIILNSPTSYLWPDTENISSCWRLQRRCL